MFVENKIWVAQSEEGNVYLCPEMANRHGLIAGASGTGKTVTLKVLAESFSEAGVPVFLADVKGDVGGMCNPGTDSEKMRSRIERFGIDDFQFKGFPVRFWDIYGENGHPVRATIDDMGPALMARLMNLSDVQTDVLNVIFQIADDKGWPIIETKDLKAILQYVNDNKADFVSEYGTMTTQSLGAVQRSIRALDDQGGDMFFGEPMLDITDWMKTDQNGNGYINILHSVKLAHNPTLYGTFLMWLMSDLFEILPEAGDLDKPKLVFFFDEAHMLFTDAPKSLVQKIEQMVKLIRSKGVGIYFISQSPSDIPDQVLAQLSNRVQHALRAYTPAEQKAVRAAATAFRPNPKFKTEDVITELGVGEVLISCLDPDGRPCMVQRAFVLPPQSYLGAISPELYSEIIKNSPLEGKYRKRDDRESAFEYVEKAKKDKVPEESAKKTTAEKKPAAKKPAAKKPAAKKESEASKAAKKAAGSAATSFGRSLGTALARSLFKKK